MTIIFDWKRTLYDPDRKKLIAGAKDVLSFLKKKGVTLVLIGKGDQKIYNEVKRLKVKKFFKQIFFNDNKERVLKIYKKLSRDKEIWIIGDRITSEIEIGNKLGMSTIWIKTGKFAKEIPTKKDQLPDFTIFSLKDLETFFTNYLSKTSQKQSSTLRQLID